MVFAQATKAQNPSSQTAKITAWVYAGVLTLLVVAQLFAFEKLVPLFQGMNFPGGAGTGSLVICLAVFCEVFALPFLLRMPLSPLMRQVSMAFGVLVPILWLFAGVVGLGDSALTNAGILGTKVSIAPAGQIVLSLFLVVLAGLSLKGLYQPGKK